MMKKIIVAMFFVCFAALILSAEEYEEIWPKQLVNGMEGRICGMGVADYNYEQLAEDRGKLEVAKNMMAYNKDAKSDKEAKLKEFIAKNFKKIEAFGTWKWGGKIYKLMCLLTEEEVQKRIDNMLTKEEHLSSEEHRCFGYEKYYEGMSPEPAETPGYIWPIKNKIYPSREDVVAGDDTAGFISSRFGDNRNHAGIDLAFKDGTPVYAAASGIVTFTGCDSRCGEVCDDKCDKGYGKYIIIAHPNGMRTLYAHLQEFKYLRGSREDSLLDQMSKTIDEEHSLKDASVQELKKGYCVKQGDQIGLVGHTGVAGNAADGTGSHLHFEIRKYSNPVDPMHYLPELSLKLVEESKMSEKAKKEVDQEFEKNMYKSIKERLEIHKDAPEETDDKKASEE